MARMTRKIVKRSTFLKKIKTMRIIIERARAKKLNIKRKKNKRVRRKIKKIMFVKLHEAGACMCLGNQTNVAH